MTHDRDEPGRSLGELGFFPCDSETGQNWRMALPISNCMVQVAGSEIGAGTSIAIKVTSDGACLADFRMLPLSLIKKIGWAQFIASVFSEIPSIRDCQEVPKWYANERLKLAGKPKPTRKATSKTHRCSVDRVNLVSLLTKLNELLQNRPDEAIVTFGFRDEELAVFLGSCLLVAGATGRPWSVEYSITKGALGTLPTTFTEPQYVQILIQGGTLTIGKYAPWTVHGIVELKLAKPRLEHPG